MTTNFSDELRSSSEPGEVPSPSLSEPGYWEIELGDVIHGVSGKGSVVQIDGKLLILWSYQGGDLYGGAWQWANDFLGTAEEEGLPFQVERREWDFDGIRDAYVVDFPGTDLPPAAA